MSVYDVPLNSIDGKAGVLADDKGKVTLLVNVASFCGLTPQYEGLENLYERFGAQGFAVLGIPCNQFGAQEPGTADEIKTFCSTSYNVDVPAHREDRSERRRPPPAVPAAHAEGRQRGSHRRHPLELREVPHRRATVRSSQRFSPMVEPENADIVGAIEKALAN